MRDIEFNWTDNELEVLFDAWPSPQCERYIRNVRCIVRWLRRASRVFLIGPAQAFGLAFLFAMMDGSRRLSADATDNLHRLSLAVDALLAQHSFTADCQDGSDQVRPTVPCAEHADVAAKETANMLRRLQLLYLVGMWFGTDILLRERRRKQRLE